MPLKKVTKVPVTASASSSSTIDGLSEDTESAKDSDVVQEQVGEDCHTAQTVHSSGITPHNTSFGVQCRQVIIKDIAHVTYVLVQLDSLIAGILTYVSDGVLSYSTFIQIRPIFNPSSHPRNAPMSMRLQYHLVRPSLCIA